MKCPKCGAEMKPIGRVDFMLLEIEKKQGEEYKPIVYQCPKCYRTQRGGETEP